MTLAIASPPPLFRRFSALVYLLVIISFAAFAYSDNRPQIFVLGFGAVLLSWFLVEGPRGKALPQILINLGVLTAAAILLGELVFSAEPNLLIGLGHFIIGINICKLFERKTSRDYGLMLTLSLLTMVAAAISSISFAFSCILIVYLCFAGYALLLFHLRMEADDRHPAFSLPMIPPDEQSRMRSHLRTVAACAALVLLLSTTCVFLLLPRFRSQDLFTNWTGSGTLQTGFSNRVQFYDNGRIQPNDAVVMEVTVSEDGMNIGSETNQPYFRGTVLDRYNAERRRWYRSGRWVETAPAAFAQGGNPLPLLPAAGANPLGSITSQFVLHDPPTPMPFVTSTLFTIAPPLTFLPQIDSGIIFDPSDFSLTLRSGFSDTYTYTITSAVLYRSANPTELAFIPPGNLGDSQVAPEVMALAQKLVADILPAGAKPQPTQIRAIAERFNNYLEDTYPYSLSFQQYDAKLDPTADFLLNRKSTGGPCEYFASAMVMLCRSMGLNARMVTGYHGGDFNNISGAYVVRQKNAHAWAEVFTPDNGWVQFDPTPGAGGSDDPFSAAKWFYDAMQIMQRGWLSSVVSFDEASRLQFLVSISAWLHHIAAIPTDSLHDFTDGMRDLFFNAASSANIGARWAVALTLLFITFLSLWLLYRWHRRRTSQVEHILKKVDPRVQRQLAHELHFFDDLLRILAKTGIRKRSQQTPREYVDALSPHLNGTADDARWLVATFYDIRFGALHVSQGLRQQITSALHRVRQNIHQPSHAPVIPALLTPAKKEAPGSQPPC